MLADPIHRKKKKNQNLHPPPQMTPESKSVLEKQDRAGHSTFLFQTMSQGSLGDAAVWHLPLAQGANLETQDRIPRWAPGAWSLLLPLPVSLPLSLTIISKLKNLKNIKKIIKQMMSQRQRITQFCLRDSAWLCWLSIRLLTSPPVLISGP